MAGTGNNIRNTKIAPKRKYVIVCNKHSGNWAGCMLFWGSLTKNEESRSFGGYTQDVDSCERYSFDEIKSQFPGFPEYTPDMTLDQFLGHENIIMQPIDLARLGLRPASVWYRP